MELLDAETFILEQDLIARSTDPTTFRERHLMVAVLRDAVECYQKYAMARHPRGRALFAEAVAWIESTDREWPFSYENICDILGLDSGGVRRSLASWGQQRAAATWRTPRIVPLFSKGEGDDAQVG
jgi:hypothetical protein